MFVFVAKMNAFLITTTIFAISATMRLSLSKMLAKNVATKLARLIVIATIAKRKNISILLTEHIAFANIQARQ